MAADVDAILEAAVVEGELQAGTSPGRLKTRGHDGRMVTVLAGATSPDGSGKPPRWTEEEDGFLRQNLGVLHEEEIARRLGRTRTAVHLRWSRDLRLPAPSKNPDIIIAWHIADTLGVDAKKGVRLLREGFIPGGRLLPLDCDIWAVERDVFIRWCVNPMNWVYFDRTRVKDPYLRRLLERQAGRWGDEWWTLAQAAEYHGVNFKNVYLYIRAGKIPGVKWRNWMVLKSDVTDPNVRFYRGAGVATAFRVRWSERADAFMVLASAIGLSNLTIAGLMKGAWTHGRVDYRLRTLHEKGYIPWLIRKYGLGVEYRHDTGGLFADWRAHHRRFPGLAGAIARFREHACRSHRDYVLVWWTLQNWMKRHAADERQRDLADRMSSAVYTRLPEVLYRGYEEVRSLWDDDPLDVGKYRSAEAGGGGGIISGEILIGRGAIGRDTEVKTRELACQMFAVGLWDGQGDMVIHFPDDVYAGMAATIVESCDGQTGVLVRAGIRSLVAGRDYEIIRPVPR